MTDLSNITRLGIIAGRGNLPKLLNDVSDNAFFVGIDGFCKPAEWTDNYAVHSLMKVGAIVKSLKSAGVSHIVLGGGVDRPSISDVILPDALGAELMANIALKGGGDDGVLRIIVEFLTKQGFVVVGVEDILGQQTFKKGILGKIKPNKQQNFDIERGIQILDNQSSQDIGQSVALQEQLVLAVEAIEGTDAMINRAANLARGGEKPTLIKAIKVNQSRLIDLPTIGVDTIITLNENNFGGLAVSAIGILILDKQVVIDKADELGLFIVAV